jgi:hypothetical protein
MPAIASIVDVDALLSVLWVSALAGIGVPGAFGLTILGTVRANDARRSGHAVEAALFGMLALASLALVALSVVIGILWMTD